MAGQFGELLPELVKRGIHRIDVFDYRRGGDDAYWLAFMASAEGPHTVSTFDFKHLSLDAQIPELLLMLAKSQPERL